jgi:hypothetical protein
MARDALRLATGVRMVRPAMLRELKLAVAVVLAATIAASIASRANAQGSAVPANLRQACGGDVRSLCSGIMPGGGRIKQCMIEKSDQLSDGCKAALKDRQAQSAGK